MASSAPIKKTVVVDLEYMRPTPEIKKRSRRQYNSDDDLGSESESESESDYESESEDIETNDPRDCVITSSKPKEVCNDVYQPCDSDYAVDSDEDLLQSVLDEPTFPLDVNAILSAMAKNENATIANTTFKEIESRRHEILSMLDLPTEKLEEFALKLKMYRVIERPNDLRHGQLLRWIPLKSLSQKPYLTLGGTIFNIKQNITDGLHQITIRTVKGFVYQIKFELNVMFQRLSKEELMILRAVEYVSDVKL
jgi:hypothetical protein